jgi:predicted RNA binding protein YcfA (HicA-like mRNA interferase family)
MRLPRDLSGEQLIKALARLGYQTTRQRGSHIRLTTEQNGRHDVTVPRSDPLAHLRPFYAMSPRISASHAMTCSIDSSTDSAALNFPF